MRALSGRLWCLTSKGLVLNKESSRTAKLAFILAVSICVYDVVLMIFSEVSWVTFIAPLAVFLPMVGTGIASRRPKLLPTPDDPVQKS